MDIRAGARIDKDTTISSRRSAFEVCAEMQGIGSRTKARSKACITRHTARLLVHRDRRIVLSGVGQISEIQQYQWAAILRELEAKQRCMVCGSHIHMDSRLQLNGEVSRVRLDRVVLVCGFPLVFGINAAIHIITGAVCIRKEREVSQRGASSSAGVVHAGEAGNPAALVREASLVAT